MKILKIFLLLSAVLFGGCADFLEEIPESQLSPSTFYISEDNVEIAVNGIYDALGEREFGSNLNFGNYNQGLLHMGHAGTDVFRGRNDNAADRFAQLDIFAYTSSSDMPSHVWTVHYIGINRANTVIAQTERMLDNPDFDVDRLTSLIAEARFLRAFFYFNLVRFYGEVPLKLTETNSLTADDVLGIARSPVLEVYEQIEEDLLFAEQHLQTAGESAGIDHGRATVTAAQSALTRLYVTWAGYPLKDATKWANAEDYANRVITSGEHSLMSNFQDVFTLGNEGNDELIFVAKFSYVEGETTASGSTTGPVGQGGANGNTPGISASFAQIRINQRYWASFEASDSVRRDWTVSDYLVDANGTEIPLTDAVKADPNTSSFGFAKFIRDGSFVGFESPYDFPLYRLADIYLYYAEALVNNNGGAVTDEALEYINKVRRRAHGLDPETPDVRVDLALPMDFDTFFDALVNERAWELAGEDGRWHDLIRWELLPEFVATRKRQIVQDNFRADTHLLFPIPQTEIDSNPLINIEDQNFGY